MRPRDDKSIFEVFATVDELLGKDKDYNNSYTTPLQGGTADEISRRKGYRSFKDWCNHNPSDCSFWTD